MGGWGEIGGERGRVGRERDRVGGRGGERRERGEMEEGRE